MAYDPEMDVLRLNEEYTRKRKIELDKALKRAKKQLQLQKH
jgi:hypothetical protein